MSKLNLIWAQHSPAIMATASIIGVGVSVVTASRATLKAERLIQEAENELKWETIENPEPRETLTPREKFELTWRIFILPTISTAATIGCVLTLHRQGLKQAAAATALYSVTEQTLSEYREKVKEHIGETKEQTIRDEVAQDRVYATTDESISIFETPYGEVLFMDSFSGRYFLNDIENVKKAQNDINQRRLNEGFVSLSEFYSLIGLPPTKTSDDIGWNLDDELDLHISTTLTQNDAPCIYIDYDVRQIVGFHRMV